MAYSCITLPNPASTGLHAAMGFTEAGVLTDAGWKNGQWRDVVWMQKRLNENTDAPREVVPIGNIDVRDQMCIRDRQKTVRKIDDAYMFVRDVAMEGKSILFVGTKKQAQESIEAEAKRCGMFYVNNRWLGGTLTNFRTIRTRIDRLNAIDAMERNGDVYKRQGKSSPAAWRLVRSVNPTWCKIDRGAYAAARRAPG